MGKNSMDALIDVLRDGVEETKAKDREELGEVPEKQKDLREFNIYFGRIIRVHRNASKLTLAELSALCGVSTNQIGFIERGCGATSLEKAWWICEALEIDFGTVVKMVSRRIKK